MEYFPSTAGVTSDSGDSNVLVLPELPAPAVHHIYMVDMENIGHDWTELLPSMTADDKVLLFYTPISASLPPVLLDKILACPADIKAVACTPGNNALDFQLVTELGRQIGVIQTDPRPFASEYIIVSRDTGFDAAVHYWQARDVSVQRTEPISHIITHKTEPAAAKHPAKTNKRGPALQSVRDRYINKLSSVPNLHEGDIIRMAEVLTDAMGYPAQNRMMEAYSRMVKAFGQSTGRRLYTMAKDVIRSIADNGPFPPK